MRQKGPDSPWVERNQCVDEVYTADKNVHWYVSPRASRLVLQFFLKNVEYNTNNIPVMTQARACFLQYVRSLLERILIGLGRRSDVHKKHGEYFNHLAYRVPIGRQSS